MNPLYPEVSHRATEDRLSKVINKFLPTMNELGRRELIGKSAMPLADATVVPKSLFGKNISPGLPKAPRTFPARLKESINDFGIVDLHCHPSLKMYLWNKKLWKRYRTS